MLASLLGAAAISAVVATLYQHQGRPLPEWPFEISVNAVLSVYSVVLKTSVAFVVDSCIGQLQWLWFRNSRSLYDAVRYDEASRGPWGSVKLLGSHTLSRPMTSFAAVLSILSIAVDPFFQQILSYRDCQVPVPSVRATIPRTSYFDKDHMYKDIDLGFFPSQGAKAALNKGVLAAPEAISSNCPTGNCTFSKFSTLGLCSSCEDITETLVTSATCYSNNTEGCQRGFRNYTSVLPSGLRMEWDMVANFSMPTAFASSFSPDTSRFEFLAPRTYFSDHQIDPSTGRRLAGCTDALPSNWRCRGYGAASCAIYPCMKTFNTSILAGKTSERLVAQTNIRDVEDHLGYTSSSNTDISPMVWVNASCLTAEEAEAVQGRVKYTDGTWLVYNTTNSMENLILHGDFSSLPQNLNLSASLFTRQCVHTFDGQFFSSLLVFVVEEQFLVGEVIAGVNEGDLDTIQVKGLRGQSQLQLLYNSGNISFDLIQDTFENIAGAFTLYIRENGNSNDTNTAPGVVYHYATCLDVHWPWIALPATLFLGSLLLLLTTQTRMERGGVPIWKSSLLPYIYRTRVDAAGADLEKEKEETGQEDEDPPVDAMEVMEKTAKATRVMLDQSPQGTRLQRQ